MCFVYFIQNNTWISKINKTLITHKWMDMAVDLKHVQLVGFFVLTNQIMFPNDKTYYILSM